MADTALSVTPANITINGATIPATVIATTADVGVSLVGQDINLSNANETVFVFLVESEQSATFFFQVDAEQATTAGLGGTNVFDRYSGVAVNLDGRNATLDVGGGGGGGGGTVLDQYTLSLTAAPQQIEPNGATTVTVRARVNGAPLANQIVSLSSSNSGIAPIASSVTTSSVGDAVFAVIGLSIGSVTLSAIMVVAGVTYTALPIILTVSTQTPPANYSATGYGRIVVSVESPLANALTGRVQRLSHSEQQRKYPDDQGLKWATYFESATVTIVPKVLQT